jgi:hypothetical protein
MKSPKGKVARLEKKEGKLVYKGNKAVDEGRDKKADRILGRAARTENRVIKATEKMKKGGSTKSFPDLNKDGKVTKADILKGRGVIKKKGGTIKK